MGDGDQRADLSLIGELAAGLMQSLEEDIAASLEDGDGPPKVRTAAVVVELEWPPADDNDHCGSTSIRFRCSDPRVWFQRGLFLEVSDIANRGREPAGG